MKGLQDGRRFFSVSVNSFQAEKGKLPGCCHHLNHTEGQNNLVKYPSAKETTWRYDFPFVYTVEKQMAGALAGKGSRVAQTLITFRTLPECFLCVSVMEQGHHLIAHLDCCLEKPHHQFLAQQFHLIRTTNQTPPVHYPSAKTKC